MKQNRDFLVVAYRPTIAATILRKTIEGYLNSVPYRTFNTIKTKLIVHAFHIARYLQSNECLI